MARLNRVFLIGNLGQKPDAKFTPGGTAECEISIAVNRSWFDKNANSRKEETTWVPITLFGRTAEVASEYLTKGRSVLIEGRLQLDQWEDKESGQKRIKLKVICENMTMLGGKGGGEDSRTPAEKFYDKPAGGEPVNEDVPF